MAQESTDNPLSPKSDPANLLLIVVGIHLRAEVADRPLAYDLLDRIRSWVSRYAGRVSQPPAPVVCSDFWFMNQDRLQKRPTISLGGPGVNALSAYYAQKLSVATAGDERMIIQLDPEFVDLRVCIWGKNHELTRAALEYFYHHHMDAYLRAVATQVEPQAD
jgi:hypothetical protein